MKITDKSYQWITALLTAGVSVLLVWRNTLVSMFPTIEMKFQTDLINDPNIYILVNHISIIICVAATIVGIISVYHYRRHVGTEDYSYRIFKWMAWGNILLCSSVVFSW